MSLKSAKLAKPFRFHIGSRVWLENYRVHAIVVGEPYVQTNGRYKGVSFVTVRICGFNEDVEVVTSLVLSTHVGNLWDAYNTARRAEKD